MRQSFNLLCLPKWIYLCLDICLPMVLTHLILGRRQKARYHYVHAELTYLAVTFQSQCMAMMTAQLVYEVKGGLLECVLVALIRNFWAQTSTVTQLDFRIASHFWAHVCGLIYLSDVIGRSMIFLQEDINSHLKFSGCYQTFWNLDHLSGSSDFQNSQDFFYPHDTVWFMLIAIWPELSGSWYDEVIGVQCQSWLVRYWHSFPCLFLQL